MRLTGRGYGLAGAAAAAAGAGLGLRYPELVLVGAVAAALLLYGLVSCRIRPALAVRREIEPDRVDRGDPCAVTLHVANPSRWRGANLVATDRCGAGRAEVPVRNLRPGGRTAVRYPVPTDRRGVVPVGPLRVRRRDPFDLVRADREHGGTGRVRVYPRRHPLAGGPPGVTRSPDGRFDRVPAGTITFDALRGYVVGDDLRRVHWRASARAGELLVREHVDTSVPHPVLLLDDRAAAYGDPADFETACEAVASIVAAACAAGLPITLALVGGAGVDSGPRRPAGAGPYLDLLTEAAPTAAGPLTDAARRARALRYGDTLVLVTGGAARGELAEVTALRGRYAAVACVVCAADGAAGPPGVLVARDGADFAAQWSAVRW
ncbi:hypothetical protein GCM10010123_09200 [Pilimelia anulata]|uniref:DUF58 domain-containing protein n=1 Tax=Pilimelia anulata TaxID=53371 RepID=A0A8J3F8V7_9ACTN|nr:DUF58 domain-containing protein [Pilimelia anulata]GGJ81576.1 hypothetical protein GCM10010123_09200 [Pilimelia anulata]